MLNISMNRLAHSYHASRNTDSKNPNSPLMYIFMLINEWTIYYAPSYMVGFGYPTFQSY